MKKNPFVFLFLLPLLAVSQTPGNANWLEAEKFSVHHFKSPELKYAPFIRWWWPGNDVEQEELKREVKLYADHYFGGLEIQPFALVMPTKGPGRSDRIMGYDTPKYYENLRFTLQEAVKNKLTVDLTDGSGWPAGGSHLTIDDNNLTLEYGIVDIPVNSKKSIAIPRAVSNDNAKAKLVGLIAVKVLKDTSAVNKTFVIDRKTIVDITSRINKDSFIYLSKEKDWKAIALWSTPDMERPMLIAKKDPGFAMNHFDSNAVLKNYNYLFGERTGLQSYFGKPLRAIFDDSYEFKANRHFSDTFLNVFKEERGYDIIKFLPVNLWPGYNNMYFRMSHPDQKPIFSFGSEDWRLRYDYDLTLSDVIGREFLKVAKDWTESRGLLHRTQTYGFNMDIMTVAGLASIPELETMLFNKGSEGGFKIITSGAHLYNRPIISAEAAVYINRAFLTTPQKLKMTFDKLLSSGANQLIYHGSAYKYFPEGYPKEGWFPFYNSALGINFSDNFNESNPFWKDLKSINQYTQRAQYVLQSGKPKSDVLIYYPFLNYTDEVGNPKEVLLNGVMEGTEPPLNAENSTSAYASVAQKEWIEKIWPLLNSLNARGITWDWVNDASLQQMSITAEKEINVRGNIYQSVILFDLPYIQLESAKKLNLISKKGTNILAIGALPEIQPSFLNFEKNDKQTAQQLAGIFKSKTALHIDSLTAMDVWFKSVIIPIEYVNVNDAFRQSRRIMEDGSLAQFIWNESDKWQTLEVNVVDKRFTNLYWMNAEDGSISKADSTKHTYKYKLGPYSSIILLSTGTEISNATKLETKDFDSSTAKLFTEIKNWDIKTATRQINNSSLFDWKNNQELKYSSELASYKSSFEIKDIDQKQKYFLDLGKVYYTAEVFINGKKIKDIIYTPFVVDVSSYLKIGTNTVEIKVTPAKFNDFVGQAIQGEKLYKKLKDSELMSQGLVGPVNLYQQN